MERLDNIDLSEFFTRHEILYAPPVHRHPRTRKIIDSLADCNQRNIDQYDERLFIALCQKVDVARALVNMHFTSDIDLKKDIGFKVTSGWRCLEWERLKGRSGKSQHVHAAIDIQPTNCSDEQAIEIMRWVAEYYWPREEGKGWYGGFALANPTYNNDGSIRSIGFIHFDNRDAIARWHYN